MLFFYILISHNHIKIHVLLFYLFPVMMGLNRLVYSWKFWFISFLLVINVVWQFGSDTKIPSCFGRCKLNVSVFFLLFSMGFSKTKLFITLKNYFSKPFFCFFFNSVFILMNRFSQAFWLNLLTLCTFKY